MILLQITFALFAFGAIQKHSHATHLRRLARRQAERHAKGLPVDTSSF